MNALGENLSKEDIAWMIKSVDIDNNKAIDFNEFKQMMKLAPIAQSTISKIDVN